MIVFHPGVLLSYIKNIQKLKLKSSLLYSSMCFIVVIVEVLDWSKKAEYPLPPYCGPTFGMLIMSFFIYDVSIPNESSNLYSPINDGSLDSKPN